MIHDFDELLSELRTEEERSEIREFELLLQRRRMIAQTVVPLHKEIPDVSVIGDLQTIHIRTEVI